MADFRRWFIALAVLCLAAGFASAQIGSYTNPAIPAGPLSCTANAAGTPQLRSEGYTELVGDVLIQCSGGITYAPGSAIPSTNITLYVTPNVAITSRLSSSSTGFSDVLLLVDDPGSTLPTGAGGAYGPRSPQILCTQVTTGGCPAFAGTDTTGGYTVAVSASGGTTNAANVYQGVLNTQGPNTVTFYGVPVLPPVTTGVLRTFRITNVRVPTVGQAANTPISVFVSTSPSTVLPVSLATLPVGIVADPGLIPSVAQPDSTGATKTGGSASTAPAAQLQCTGISATPVINLIFKEGFGTSFKTRVVPLSNTAYAAEGTNTGTPGQNVPGGLYGGFATNSESDFIYPGLLLGSQSQYTAGLADFGTRLKAVFTNIPAGITLYVSGINREGWNFSTGASAVTIGGTSTQSTGILVYTGSSSSTEAFSDGTNFGASNGSGGQIGIISQSYTPTLVVPNASGVGTAVWEVTNTNPAAIDTLTFTVYIGFRANPGAVSTANPYGLPSPTTPTPSIGQNNVSLSFAPEPGGGTFTAAQGPVPGTSVPIPRFAIVHPFNAAFAIINLCQTTLLYPFVTANPSGGLGVGFDTGIAVANTSTDPFGALGIPTSATPQIGSCTLYPYGVSISATGTQTAAPPVLKGCDAVTNPVPTQNCFPIVPSGTVATVLASQVFPTFQGYVIAVCNFQYAHGYAAVTDLGLRGLFSSYLAIVLEPNTALGNTRGIAVEQNGR